MLMACRINGLQQRPIGRRNFSPFAWYNKHLEKSPIITKSITSGSECSCVTYTVVLCYAPMILYLSSVLFSLGDVIAQVFIGDKDSKFDYARTGRAWIFGTFILGPLAHAHFTFLDWFIVKKVCVIT